MSLRWRQRLLPFMLLAVPLVSFCVWGAPTYERNDDMAIVSLLRGLNGWPVGSDNIFVSRPLTFLLANLYRTGIDLPFYEAVLYSALIVDFAVAVWLVCSLFRSRWALAGAWFFVLLTFFSLASRTGFTSISLCTWVMATLLVVHLEQRGGGSGWLYWLAGFGFCFAYLLRPSLSPLFAMASLPLLATLWRCSGKKIIKPILLPLLCALVLNGMGQFSRNSDSGWADYLRFNEARAVFMDTPRGDYHPEHSSGALAAADWSLEDYVTAKGWWLYDKEVFNEKAFSGYVRENSGAQGFFSFQNLKASTIRHQSYLLAGLFYIVLSLTAFCGTMSLKSGARSPFALSVWLLSLLVMVLMGFRFPGRVGIPLLLLVFFCASMVLSRNADMLAEPGRIRRALAILSMGCLIVLFGLHLRDNSKYRQFRSYQAKSYKAALAQIDKLSAGEAVIVTLKPDTTPDLYKPFAADSILDSVKMFPGGWTINSPPYYDYLDRWGFPRSNVIEGLLNDRRVFLLFWDRRGEWEAFEPFYLGHLSRHYARSPDGRKRMIRLEKTIDLRSSGFGPLVMRFNVN